MLYEFSNGILTAKISLTGGDLRSLEKDGMQYVWQAKEGIWADSDVVMFPYVARSNGGRCTVNGRPYPMPIHGLCIGREFRVFDAGPASVTVGLDSSADTKAHFPYDFEFRIRYALRKNVLEKVYSVKNTGPETMYYGLGSHFGFQLPARSGYLSDWYLQFEKECTPERIGFTRDTVLLNGESTAYPLKNGREIALTHSVFYDDAIVLSHADGTVSLNSRTGPDRITVRYPDCDYIAFWQNPVAGARYVCIEPWYALPARADRVEELTRQETLLSLESGKQAEKTVFIQISDTSSALL